MIWLLCVFRFLDFIWYIGHLVSLYQVRKTLPCCIKDLWGQKNGRGTLTSNIFLTLCNNIILLFIVINNFDTTLSTFCPWRHSGRNMFEVLIFSKHTLWALNKPGSRRVIQDFVWKKPKTPPQLTIVCLQNVIFSPKIHLQQHECPRKNQYDWIKFKVTRGKDVE